MKPQDEPEQSTTSLIELFWEGAEETLRSDDDVTLLSYLSRGLIFVKEGSLMLRCRMTGAELTSSELRGLATIAKNYGGDYADITTRANFQIRDIGFSDGLQALRDLLKMEFIPAVAGLNNLRNVTVSPTSGFGKYDLYDVIPLAKSIHEALLYSPELQGLPGKFNIGLDSGGAISVATESNDIGLLAVESPEGVKFRMSFADIRKGETVSTDSGWLLKPEQVLDVVSATVKVFLEKGEFKIRLKSRVKFLIERLSIEVFKNDILEEINFIPEEVESREIPSNRDKTAYCGVVEQKDNHFCYVGVVGASGRISADQMTSIANISEQWGRDMIRLTTKQTCIIPFVKKEDVDKVVSLLRQEELSISSKIAGAIVACTGSKGCSYSATDTKLHSKQLNAFLEGEIELSEPVNIHFTGCSFSCAQTYIGDIGLLGVKSSGQECYHLFLGGGADQNQNSTRIFKALPVAQVFIVIKQLLHLFNDNLKPGESFNSFVHRRGAENIISDINLDLDKTI